MSEGANSLSQLCENSLTNVEDDPELLPPRIISHTIRRPRFGTGNVQLSPYILIDGRKLRSSLALSKKRPPRRVSFPANDNHLVTGYLEPTNPWKHADNVNHEDLISAYKESCEKHNTNPLEVVISQLEGLDVSERYSKEFNLQRQVLHPNQCESLEEIFKRIQFNKVNLEATSLNDESSVILFDMLEYYESTRYLNISSNPGIGLHGWQACANMIRKTQCLEHLEAKGVILDEQYMNILSRALRLVCHLHVLKLENCGLSGRSIVTLVSALKMNKGIRELYLADNGLNLYDAIQLGSLLRFNNHLQLLDISNNNIQDDGVRDILEGLIHQINEDKDGKGLNILVLWNNQLTQKSSPYFARIIALSKTIETLNIGKNKLTDELIFIIKDALEKNRVLLQLGMQSIDLTCKGILTLSEIIKINQILQRIDLRSNDIQITGLKALSSAMKENKFITKIDLDENPKFNKVDNVSETLRQYMQLVAEIEVCCSQNEQNRSKEGNIEGSENAHHNSLCSTNSRKISLTCQTLPCSLPTMISIQRDESERSFLEPKRINGGRLRSPALSPNSSPITSPVPAPSRSRFVVSRVPEALHSSSESPPAHLTSTASGPSRFRVSIVESASTMPSPKPVVASSEAKVAPNFNFKLTTVESTDSDDSDNVHSLGRNRDENVAKFRDANAKDTRASPSERQRTAAAVDARPVDDRDSKRSIASTERAERIGNDRNEVAENVRTTESKSAGRSDELTTVARRDVEATNSFRSKRTKSQSSSSTKFPAPLERSTDSASDSAFVSDLRYTSTVENSTTNGITSKDKLLEESTDIICNYEKHELSTALEARAAKSIAIFQLLNLESLKNVFPLFKLMANLNAFESWDKFYPRIRTEMNLLPDRNCRNDLLNVKHERAVNTVEGKQLVVEGRRQAASSVISNRSLLRDGRLNNCVLVFDKDTVLMENRIASDSNLIGSSWSKLVNNILLIPILKKEMPSSKLMTMHDCSVLRATGSRVGNGNMQEMLDKVGLILIKRTCDETLTNSINFISDNSCLFYSIIYDITNASDTLTVHMFDRLRDFIILNLNEESDGKSFVFRADNTETNLVRFARNERPDCNVHDELLVYRSASKVNVKANCLNDRVTRMYRTDDNNSKKAFTDIHNILRNEIDGIDNYYNSHDSPDWQAATVNTVPELGTVMRINFVRKDNGAGFGDDANFGTSVVCLNDVTDASKIEEIVKRFTEEEKYFCARRGADTRTNAAVSDDAPSSSSSSSSSTSRTYPCATVFNTFVPRDLVFSVAGASVDDTSGARELLSENISNDAMELNTSFYNLPQIPDSSAKLLINKAEDIRRDSAASRHGNENFPLNYNVEKSAHLHDKRTQFAEDNYPDIESECFPMYRKPYSIANSKSDLCLLEKDRVVSHDSSENMYIFPKFGSNIAQQVKCTTSDAICDMTHKYFNTIKCAVATTICSKGTVNARDDMTVEIISDKSTNVVKPSSVIRKTSKRRNVEGEESEMEEEMDANEDMETESENDSEEYDALYDLDEDDEVDEFEEFKMQLEPKYAKYARWRI